MKTSTKVIMGSLVAATIIMAGSAMATTPTNPTGDFDFDQELTKITAISTAIVGIVGSFTTAAVAPSGLSAAIKSFRHIVLNNV